VHVYHVNRVAECKQLGGARTTSPAVHQSHTTLAFVSSCFPSPLHGQRTLLNSRQSRGRPLPPFPSHIRGMCPRPINALVKSADSSCRQATRRCRSRRWACSHASSSPASVARATPIWQFQRLTHPRTKARRHLPCHCRTGCRPACHRPRRARGPGMKSSGTGVEPVAAAGGRGCGGGGSCPGASRRSLAGHALPGCRLPWPPRGLRWACSQARRGVAGKPARNVIHHSSGVLLHQTQHQPGAGGRRSDTYGRPTSGVCICARLQRSAGPSEAHLPDASCRSRASAMNARHCWA
jgi:hypothetical protein